MIRKIIAMLAFALLMIGATTNLPDLIFDHFYQTVETTVPDVVQIQSTIFETEPTIARESEEIQFETWKITGYCACEICCPNTSDGITASGTKVDAQTTVAADKSIPFGTQIYIDGLGIKTVEDRGSAVNGNHIDVYFDSHEKAKQFGVQYLQIKILGEENAR